MALRVWGRGISRPPRSSTSRMSERPLVASDTSIEAALEAVKLIECINK